MRKVRLSVPDISCEHCERVVTAALTPLAGVHSVKVDIPAHEIDVEYDDSAADIERMKQALADEDYPVRAVVESRPGR